MSSEEIIMRWKNPELRDGTSISHPSGLGFQELDLKEISSVCGGNGEIQPQGTPAATVISALASFVGSYLVTAVFCK
ncbi:bacteriocin leader domain-containing protein [Pradoshia sp. D12]|uniref:bacteriocin leader domain-containing protein n=1 Tax=Bacillaceae TaxID=186817 RepID=UPI00112DE968|nr:MULTISPECIES: bacteriocin leader domain-containing protein [Bacillaceae]QFK72956.1 bacteriocin leader domain-containing protein [Pradoshia sp. D12]TPF71948.1 bacteriocin leader domain-containing protein [Bacillus sp. D12]